MQLKTVPGLTVIQPRGAMYVMVGIDGAHFADIADDVDFSQKLLREQVRAYACLLVGVFCLLLRDHLAVHSIFFSCGRSGRVVPRICRVSLCCPDSAFVRLISFALCFARRLR